MTVSTTNNRINQVADGIQLSFVYDYIVNDASHMMVYLDNVLQATGYTVNGVGNPLGGDVTFVIAPANDVIVTLQRIVPLTQLVDYLPYDPFPAETHEAALDKLTLELQQVSDEISRAIKADVTTPEGTSYTLPLPDAGSFLQWNITEDGFINVHISELGDLVVTTSYTELFLTAVDAVAARATLEVYSKDETDGLVEQTSNIPARNAGLTKDVLSQPSAAEAGVSSVIYTGDGAVRSIDSGVNMLSGNFGGLVWIKSRSAATGHRLVDTVRGVTKSLASEATATEATEVAGLTTFNALGFDLGADTDYNANAATYIAWSWQTNQKTSGLTNRNKPYTAHYNADMGFSIVGYVGDGADGHEIPHHLGVVPELSIFKNRDGVNDWIVQSSLFSLGDNLRLNESSALANSAVYNSIFSDVTSKLSTSAAYNGSADNFIQYNFASKSGVCKIGKYIGTSAAGNYVSTEVDGGDAFKPSFVMVKNLTVAGDNWVIVDSIRPDPSYLFPNSSAAEGATPAFDIDFVDSGLEIVGTDNHVNQLNSEYIFIAFAETSIDATKAITDYPLPTNADELAAAQNLLTFANGFDALGQVDEQEEVVAGTLAFGIGHEDKTYYLYRNKGISYGRSEVRPLVGLTRDDADKYGLVSPSDKTLRATSKHFDYESDSGVVLASGEDGTSYAWLAFNKDSNDIYLPWIIAAITNSWLQYKHIEKRILKSWRLREESTTARTPRLFTIEGSLDGLNWTAIDSSYTASDYIGNGGGLWGDLQDVSANTIAYLYHRINITANNGDATFTTIAELELNTIIDADYYLIDDAKMYNDAGTRIDRVYYSECKTDSAGNVISFINYAPAKLQLNEVGVHGDLTVHGQIKSAQSVTAMVSVDCSQSPPLILSSVNIKNVISVAAGIYDLVFEAPMDNIDYIAVGMGEDTSFPTMGADPHKSVEKLRIVLRDNNAAVVQLKMDIVIFGGKNIK